MNNIHIILTSKGKCVSKGKSKGNDIHYQNKTKGSDNDYQRVIKIVQNKTKGSITSSKQE